jgi:hypothetical protein
MTRAAAMASTISSAQSAAGVTSRGAIQQSMPQDSIRDTISNAASRSDSE